MNVKELISQLLEEDMTDEVAIRVDDAYVSIDGICTREVAKRLQANFAVLLEPEETLRTNDA